MQQESNLTNAYLEAYQMACMKLMKCNAESVCQNSKAAYEKETGTYGIRFFDHQYRINCTDTSVSFEESPAEPATTEKVLMLHYLIHAQPKPFSGRNISFKEVPNGGSIYYSTFKKRAIDPLVKTFSNDLSGFAEAASALGGIAESFGDASATIYAFPFVPVTYVLWQGDEEVPSAGTILFDSSVSHFLPVEDIVLAASFGAYKLIGANKK
ncbi:MAG TPA: DUF3786 domain-containing protein [Anaerovoracaceae bacterium]|nr:DUF3786 domain-containing protein [Anaerovoracaceae bacterium]